MIKISASIWAGEFSVALSDVQGNGRAGSIQLVEHSQALGQAPEQRLQPAYEGQRGLVDLELLMIESAYGIGSYD
jgi:hypothetical protein